MILCEAQEILSKALKPYSYDQFFESIVGRKSLALLNEQNAYRNSFLGDTPKKLILQAFTKYAAKLTCHIHTPKIPPPSPKAVCSANEFQELIGRYHQNGYTVRIPEVTDLCEHLSQFTRALEVILEKTVGVVIFWSEQGAAAPIHHDDVDVIVIQLYGTKRWFISNEAPKLPNKWKSFGERPPLMQNYDTFDVQAGDLLYVPRGAAHTVQSTGESIHLSIGFVPVTVRDGINAALDNLSDLDRPLREDLGRRADSLTRKTDFTEIIQQIQKGIEQLKSICQSHQFIHESLAFRRARMIYDLPKLSSFDIQLATHINNRVKHSLLAIAHLEVTEEIIDLRLPGEQLLIHLGAEESILFVVENTEFFIRELPGEVTNEVKIALVNKLLANGFLTLVG